MPGNTYVQGAQPVEYVSESSFATDEADASYNWIGLVTSHSVTQEVVSANIRYLPGNDSTDKLENVRNEKVSEAYESEITYHPQDFTFLQYFTGSSSGTSDTVDSVQIGEQNESGSSDEFRRILGAVGEEWSLTISEDSAAECTATLLGADSNDWSATDYVGAGSHATENSADPFTYDDLSSVQLGGSNVSDAIEELVLTVTNELVIVKDPNVSINSNIAAIVPVTREIVVELSLTYDDMSMAQTVRNYTPQDLTFDVGATSFTVNDVQFPEFPYEMTPEDMVGDTVSSDPCSGLSWS